ncbi:MAG: cobamide remodeling phosphodiesterase CbiR [Candidatus Ozemobacteraceae bacterium]
MSTIASSKERFIRQEAADEHFFRLKNRCSFRLGTTSFILQDDILPNVRWLAQRIDDVELVLFESDGFSNLPSPAVVSELRAIAADHALSYTVHLPLDMALGHADETVRQDSIACCMRLFDRMEPLSPFAYVVHFTGDKRAQMPTDDMPRWLDGHREALSLFSGVVGSRRLCVETLEYPFELVEPVVEELDLAVCLDIGHLLLMGRHVRSHLDRLAGRIRIVHAHGIIDGKDHQTLAACNEPVLINLLRALPCLPQAPAVLTMEIFSLSDFQDSMRVMNKLLCESDSLTSSTAGFQHG